MSVSHPRLAKQPLLSHRCCGTWSLLRAPSARSLFGLLRGVGWPARRSTHAFSALTSAACRSSCTASREPSRRWPAARCALCADTHVSVNESHPETLASEYSTVTDTGYGLICEASTRQVHSRSERRKGSPAFQRRVLCPERFSSRVHGFLFKAPAAAFFPLHTRHCKCRAHRLYITWPTHIILGPPSAGTLISFQLLLRNESFPLPW